MLRVHSDNHKIALTVVNVCLRVLRERAAQGPQAKPTVKELNMILCKLEQAAKALAGE